MITKERLSEISRESLLVMDRLSKNYRMGEVMVHALCDVNFTIEEGEMLCILGPSGSGKSTLLNIVGGLDTPSSGKMLFQGRDLSRYSASELTLYRRHQIGFVFQFYNLIPSLTALENVELSTEIAQSPLPVEEVLSWVGLRERADHFPSQLSGGEQQRVAIARAVAKNPKMLLCDEPTGALDYETGKMILGTLRNIHRQTGKTCLIITHNADIGKMADRVVRMRSGRIVEEIVNPSPLSPEEISW